MRRWPVTVISLDTAVHKEHGDVFRPEVVEFWRQAILAGRIHDIVLAPPCETWSGGRSEQMNMALHLCEVMSVRLCYHDWSLDICDSCKFLQSCFGLR